MYYYYLNIYIFYRVYPGITGGFITFYTFVHFINIFSPAFQYHITFIVKKYHL